MSTCTNNVNASTTRSKSHPRTQICHCTTQRQHKDYEQRWHRTFGNALRSTTGAAFFRQKARTHARTHVRTHARTHSRTHARTHTRTHARTHARTHTHTDTHAHALAHTDTHAHAHTYIQVRRETDKAIAMGENTHLPKNDHNYKKKELTNYCLQQ